MAKSSNPSKTQARMERRAAAGQTSLLGTGKGSLGGGKTVSFNPANSSLKAAAESGAAGEKNHNTQAKRNASSVSNTNPGPSDSPEKKRSKTPSKNIADTPMVDEHGNPIESAPKAAPVTPASMKNAATAGTKTQADGSVMAPIFVDNSRRPVIRQHKLFVKICLPIPERDTSDKKMTQLRWLRQNVINFFQRQQQDVDDSIVLLSYVPTDPKETDAIQRTDWSDLPFSISNLRKYLGRDIRSQRSGAYKSWLDMRIGLNGDAKQILEDMKATADEGTVIYDSPLQVPYPITPVWLMYSFDTMNEDWYTHLFNGMFEQVHDGRVKLQSNPRKQQDKPLVIALKRKVIYDGISRKQEEETNGKDKRKVFAIHVVCQEDEKLACTALMQWALGTKFFRKYNTVEIMAINTYDRNAGPNELQQLRDCIDQHKQITKQIYSVPLKGWKRDLDVKNKKNKSLRHLLMKLERNNRPGQPILCGVDMSENRDTILVSFSQAFDDEARPVVQNAAAYLYHAHGDDGLHWFTEQTRSEVKSLGWDEATNTPKTRNQELLKKALAKPAPGSQMDMMFDFSEMEKPADRAAPAFRGRPPKQDGEAYTKAFSKGSMGDMSNAYDSQGRLKVSEGGSGGISTIGDGDNMDEFSRDDLLLQIAQQKKLLQQQEQEYQAKLTEVNGTMAETTIASTTNSTEGDKGGVNSTG